METMNSSDEKYIYLYKGIYKEVKNKYAEN